MKHLVILALRYLRRQKLRTALTFLSILLSVFLVCSVAAYLSSGYTSLKENEIVEMGSWEADLTSLLGEGDEAEKNVNIIRNHVSVSDSFTDLNAVYGSFGNKNGYIDLSFDGSKKRIKVVTAESLSGNSELTGNVNVITFSDKRFFELNEQDDKSLAYFPEWLRDNYGYKEGDTIELTLTPVQAETDTDDPRIRSIIDEYAEKNRTGKVYYDFVDIDDEEARSLLGERQNGQAIKDMSLTEVLTDEFTLDEIPVKNVHVGSAYKVKLKIAGFVRDTDFLSKYKKYSLMSLNVVVPEGSPLNLSELDRLNPDITDGEGDPLYSEYGECKVRIRDDIEFGDGMNKLIHDLGYDEEYYIVLGDHEIHSDLLRLELKSAMELGQIMGFIAVLLIMIVIAWLLARFIIDNAFNISVQERSVQFAVLRIMGTSKAQIAALVLTEAAFYAVTAVPLGAVSAFALCKYVVGTVSSLVHLGFRYSLMKPFAFAGIGLCVLAIFVSALTSALWASRRMSPTEAMNYGKPKVKKNGKRRQKKLNRGPVSFFMNYTKRNLHTHMNQNVVATIALALGVMMFTSCMFLGLIIKKNRELYMGTSTVDFELQLFNYEDKDKTGSEIEDSGLFAKIYSEEYSFLYYNVGEDSGSLSIHPVSRKQFEKYFAEETGYSYDDFRDKHYALRKCYDSMAMVDHSGILAYDSTADTFTDEDMTLEYHITNNINEYELGDVGLYVAEENYQNEVVKAPSSDCVCFFRMRLKSAKDYEKAYKRLMKISEENYGSLNDYFIEGTGSRSLLRAVVTMGASFIFSVWLAGVFAMISVINTSVLNRRRELAMLRAVGMTKIQLYATVIYESVRFSLASTVIGSILGIAFSAFGAIMIDMGALGSISTFITWSVVITVALNTVVAAIAAIPALSGMRKNLRADLQV